ncbi:MAG: hypothetical protein DRQ51_09860 [Gammaproteobacteria bacterium]|nr:MAG: hypothetical protein DRQ51_09860 [Gammaproteobacteria bacterium]
MTKIKQNSKWHKKIITTDNGEEMEAIEPIIISASRSTDIPAYHSKWFINRLNVGYCVWVNPFNRANPQYVSFIKLRIVVFWTKNPKPLMPFLHILDEKNINYYFQYSLNDYDKEGFEPNVSSLSNRIKSFQELSQKIGKEKVIWRFDPLILTPQLSVADLLNRIDKMGEELVPYTRKFVFSFVDILNYRKVQGNLIRDTDIFNKDNIRQAEFNHLQKEEFSEGLQQILKKWQKIEPDFKIATCAEDIDLSKYDIEHNKCIDDDLMKKLFYDDKILMDFIGSDDDKPNQADIFGKLNKTPKKKKLKDTGQRTDCGCIISKDIGAYNTCHHLCTYCYANTSIKAVKDNQKSLDNNSEGILPFKKPIKPSKIIEIKKE